MLRYFLAPVAVRDVEAILVYTQDQYGEQARLRYEALLAQAMHDVAEDPERLGTLTRPDILEVARTYHLHYSRNRVESPVGRVGRPRHLLLYRKLPDGRVEIGRVIHESMDL